MNCREALLIMDAVMDGEAGEHEEQMLHFHMAGCPACRRAMQMNRDFSRVFRGISRPEPPADLEARVRARLSSTPAADRRRPSMRRAAFALPFVAAILLAIGLSFGSNDDRVHDNLDSATRKAGIASLPVKRPVTTPALTAYMRPAGLVTF